MSSLATLYLSIAVAVCAVVAVVAIKSAAADVVAGVIVLLALAVAGRVVIRLAGDGDEMPPDAPARTPSAERSGGVAGAPDRTG
jgi:hypothetical protein